MSNFYTQILKDTNTQTIIKLVGVFDSSTQENNPNRVDVSSLSNAFNIYKLLLSEGGPELDYYNVSIKSIYYNISDGYVDLFYNNYENTILTLSGNGIYGYQGYGIPINNYIYQTNGDIGLRTVGMTNNSVYTIILELRKDATTYNYGQLQEPQSFNYTTRTDDLLTTEDYTLVFIDTELDQNIEVRTG